MNPCRLLEDGDYLCWYNIRVRQEPLPRLYFDCLTMIE